MAVRKNVSKWGPVFFATLKECGNVSEAARVAGVDRKTPYLRKANDLRFAAQWEDCIQEAADTLEQEANRRAMAGSDLLLIFLLKGLRPEKYRERVTLPPAELDRLIEQALAERRTDETQPVN